MNAEKNIQAGWDFIFDKLWCEKTKLIYDYRTSEDADGAFRHLPTKEEIEKSYPNPCGWYTGMEDGDISGGMMLDAALYRYELTKDPSMKKYADDLYDGLMANVTFGDTKGFLIRTRLPEDGKTHYVNSSRDQYTHWVFAMIHFYNSELSTKEQRVAIKNALVSFAEKAEHDLTPDNKYHSLLNDAGKPSLVCYMKGEMINRHESLRTAMLYMAAYAVTKDEHWLEKYKEERAWGLEFAEKIQPDGKNFPLSFALMQMQLSVKLIYDYETEPEYKARYKALMERVATGCEHFALEAKEVLKGVEMPKTVISWRDCPQEFIGTEWNPYGYEVKLPNVYKASGIAPIYWNLRNLADAIITQALCEDRALKAEQVSAFQEIVENISFADAFNHTPVSYCLAWWMLKRNKKK